jgi:hemolysin activation/secretion protein
MLITFTPPPPPSPLVMEYVEPKYGAVPTTVESHGYRYVVTGNTLLPPARLIHVLEAASSPREALGNLLKTYQNSGHMLVAVTGNVVGKHVAVSVFQGMLTEVTTANGLGPFFAGLKDDETIQKSDLERDQILAGGYASRSGEDVHLNLAPASNPGSSALTVSQTPVPNYFPVSGNLLFGNIGSRYSSDYIAGADAAANLPHGVQVTGNFQQGLPGLSASSFGSNYYQTGVGASIVTPYGIYGATVGWTHYRLGDLTYPLNPDGNIFSLQFSGTQLVYADDSTRLSLNETFNHIDNKETGYYQYYTLLNQNYDYVSVGGNINHALTAAGLAGNVNLALTFNQGISGVSGTFADGVPGVPTSHFSYATTGLTYQQSLPHGFNAILTGQAQISADTLPQEQQWVLGGLGNLTAWDPSAALGDSGYAARFEVDAPTFHRFGTSAVLGAFLETGGATLRTPPSGTAPWQTLSDVGISLKLQLPYHFSATVMAALPIERAGYEGAEVSALDDNRINAFFVVQKGF